VNGWLLLLGGFLIAVGLFFAWALAAQAGQADRREEL
jgi:hypothetical protein